MIKKNDLIKDIDGLIESLNKTNKLLIENRPVLQYHTDVDSILKDNNLVINMAIETKKTITKDSIENHKISAIVKTKRSNNEQLLTLLEIFKQSIININLTGEQI